VRHELEEDGLEDAALAQVLRDAMSLVWRILLAWLALLALFVVAGWVN
jgi:AmpE protein